MERDVEEPVGSIFHLRLGVFCADGNSAAWTLLIRVSKPNTYKPRFEEDEYIFYVPRGSMPPINVGQVRVWDEDPVIYNSKLTLTLAGLGRNSFELGKEGNLRLIKPIRSTMELAAESCDYGSPQLCSSVPIRVIPVSVTPPLDVRVEASTERYQIVTWRKPTFGVPQSYLLTIDEKHKLDGSKRSLSVAADIEKDREWGFFLNPVDKKGTYFVRVSALAGNDTTPSEPILLPEILVQIHCSSQCKPGGDAVCYWDGSRSKQLWLGEEPQCLCHPGFTGLLCKEKEECGSSIAYTAVGPTVWDSVRVNTTAYASCPFGPRHVKLSRRCSIDKETNRPAWDLVDMSFSNQCVTKVTLSSVFTQ